MWKFKSKSPRKFMIEVFCIHQGEIERVYTQEKDIANTYQKLIDKYEDDYCELRINLNVYEILDNDWEDEEA